MESDLRRLWSSGRFCMFAPCLLFSKSPEAYRREGKSYKPLLRRLIEEKASPALRSILFAGPLSAKLSAYTDDITVFVSGLLDIKAVKKAVTRYEQIAWAKINFDKSEGMRLGVWGDGVPLPGPFTILWVWFGAGFQIDRKYNVDSQVGT